MLFWPKCRPCLCACSCALCASKSLVFYTHTHTHAHTCMCAHTHTLHLFSTPPLFHVFSRDCITYYHYADHQTTPPLGACGRCNQRLRRHTLDENTDHKYLQHLVQFLALCRRVTTCQPSSPAEEAEAEGGLAVGGRACKWREGLELAGAESCREAGPDLVLVNQGNRVMGISSNALSLPREAFVKEATQLFCYLEPEGVWHSKTSPAHSTLPPQPRCHPPHWCQTPGPAESLETPPARKAAHPLYEEAKSMKPPSR